MTWEWRDGGGSSGVQVKSTIYKRRGDGYSLNVMGPKRKKYVPGTVDFFAVLLIPIDDWYIIPFEVMGRKNLSLHFTPKSKRQKYGKYQEAWELLRGPVEIQAGWEKGSGAVAAEAEARFLAALGMTTSLGRARRPSCSRYPTELAAGWCSSYRRR